MDFSPYLHHLITEYAKQPDRYTLTDLQVEYRQEEQRSINDSKTAKQTKKKVDRLEVLAGLRKYGQQGSVLLVGKPGSGKSTALGRLRWELAQSALEDETEPIPVLVALRSLRNNYGVLDAIAFELQNGDPDIEVKDIRRLLLKGRFFLLFDGLNEVPSDNLRADVELFRGNYGRVPMIFTSRELGSGIEQKLEMCGLTERQMRSFVEKYLPDYADVLLRQLSNRLRDLAETPLLLKLLCDVFDPETQQIPQSKGELFRAVDAKYNTWKTNEGVRTTEKFWQWNGELLRYLAFVMLQADGSPTGKWLQVDRTQAEQMLEEFMEGRVTAPGEKAKDWLQDLLEHHLLQVAANPNQIEFHHQLFQEYYAAEHLLLQLPNLDDAKLKRDYLNLLKWTEPLAVMLSLVNEKDAVQVVELALEVDLRLGSQIAGEVKKLFQNQVINVIVAEPVCQSLKIKLLGETFSEAAAWRLNDLFDEVDSCERVNVFNALAQIGGEAAILGALKASDDPTFHSRVFLFLVRELSDGAFQLLKVAVEHSDPDIRWAASLALAENSSEEAIQVLHRAIRNPSCDVQFPAAFALGTLGFESAIPVLKQAIDSVESSAIHGMAIYALSKIDSEESVLLFRQFMKDPNLGNLAINTLRSMNSDDIAPRLRKMTHEPMHKFQNHVVKVLNSKPIPDSLIRAIREDSRPDVVASAALLLRKAGILNPQILDALWKHQIKLYQKEIAETIAAIQTNCQFYNYDLFRSDPVLEQTIPGQSPIYNFNAPVGIVNTEGTVIHGDQTGIDSRNNQRRD